MNAPASDIVLSCSTTHQGVNTFVTLGQIFECELVAVLAVLQVLDVEIVGAIAEQEVPVVLTITLEENIKDFNFSSASNRTETTEALFKHDIIEGLCRDPHQHREVLCVRQDMRAGDLYTIQHRKREWEDVSMARKNGILTPSITGFWFYDCVDQSVHNWHPRNDSNALFRLRRPKSHPQAGACRLFSECS